MQKASHNSFDDMEQRDIHERLVKAQHYKRPELYWSHSQFRDLYKYIKGRKLYKSTKHSDFFLRTGFMLGGIRNYITYDGDERCNDL